MTLSVHLAHRPEPEDRRRLCDALAPEIELTLGPEGPTPARYQILVAGRPSREDLTASPHLDTLVIPWSGLPEETRKLMLDFPQIAVHNLHHNATPVAEMVVTLMLAAARQIVPADRALRGHDWRPRYRPTPALLMAGRTALILGYGAVGRKVGHICRALGMRVLAIRRRPEGEADVYPPAALHRLLPQADALLVCLPHTPETDGLVGARELALLPRDAVLVNVGRGAIVDQGALYRALREGDLFAAGLDVWYNYPADEDARAHTPPADHPFHELDNVVMSPHRAGGTTSTGALRMQHLAALLNTAARGEPLPNPVDVEAGY
jgi:phosphoglycerate dehydrogenase-like enzyme